jgi:hypothetical protein
MEYVFFCALEGSGREREQVGQTRKKKGDKPKSRFLDGLVLVRWVGDG